MRTTLAVVATVALTFCAAPAFALPTPADGPAPVSISDQNAQDALVPARDRAIDAARTATGHGVADPAITSAFARASDLTGV